MRHPGSSSTATLVPGTRLGRYELRSLDTTTNVSGVVLRLPAEFISGPALSPDGRTLYLHIIKPQGDIVIARLGNGTF